jgi:hypothetical protein
MLAHWLNSQQVDVSPHSDTLSWFWAHETLILSPPESYMLDREAANTNCIVFGLTQKGLEPTIYRTWDELAIT